MTGVGHTGATRGRTRITQRAIDRVVSGATADALQVQAKSVSVRTSDEAGGLAVAVVAPIGVAPLGALASNPPTTGSSVIERASFAQAQVRERVTELAGVTVDSLALRIDGIILQSAARVQ